MCRVYDLPESDFKMLVSKSSSYSSILEALGLVSRGGTSSKKLKCRISELGCDISHFSVRGQWTPRQDLNDVLVENSTYTNISRLKQRIVAEGLLEYKCVDCGNDGIWNGKPLTLQLDHVNGVSNDHRLVNLRFLCPNCHTQTSTYAGRNK